LTLEIKYRAIDELIPYANNARTHSDEQVAFLAMRLNYRQPTAT
jgi:hypothetical protein